MLNKKLNIFSVIQIHAQAILFYVNKELSKT